MPRRRTNGPVRALFVVTSPERRGAEVFAATLATLLPARGVEVDVVALVPTPTDRPLDVAVLGASRRSIGGLRALVRAARAHDVVVAHGGDTLLPTVVAATVARRPFVYRNVGDPGVWAARRGAAWRLSAPLRRAAAVAALSPRAATVFAELHGVAPGRIHVIPNAAPADRFAALTADERASRRAEFGLGDDRTWVGLVGALSPEKRPTLAIDAVAADDRLGLVLAGDGPERDACRAAAAGLGDRVRWLGTTDDPAAVLGAVDVVVLPSRTEGMPATAIEAGLCETPVVATDVGDVGQVVEHGRTGLLVAVDVTADDLARALVEAADRGRELGAAAGERCRERFSFDTVAGRWSDLLVSMVPR